MSRPIPCAACRALGCSCDGIRHVCSSCGHTCTVHPSSKEAHDGQQVHQLIHHEAHGKEARSLLEGEAFDRIVAAIEAEGTTPDPSARPDRRAVPRRARRMEAIEAEQVSPNRWRGELVEPYHDRPGVHPLERLALIASTMAFAAYCTWWLWRGGR